MFSIPLYFQVTKNATTGESGAYMISSIAGNTAGGLLTGMLIKRYGRYKFPTVLSGISSIICFALLLAFWRGATPVWQAAFVFPGGFATGMAHSAVFVGLAAGVEEKDMAIAGSGLYLSGSIGGVAGLSSASAVFMQTLRPGLLRNLSRARIPNSEEVS